MAVKTTRASVEKVRRGIQERTGVTPTARHSEIPSLKSTANTEQVLRDLGQTDVARGSNTFSVEAAKKGSPITSGFVNAYADNPKLAAAASFLTGSSVANDIFRQRQNEAMKGTLTNEMKSAGLTQADIDTWNAEQNEKERQQVMSQWAKEHPIMTTLNAIPENAFGSIEGNINKTIDYVKGNPIQSKETNADIYRRSVSENINSGLGRGAYGVANSIGDMLFAAWLTGGLGGGGATQGAKGLAKLLKGLPAAGVMGLEKSNQVMNDASERGLSNNQIAAEGLLSGASTALTEALPFSKFGEGGHILGSMLAEGLQEGSEDILDTFFDELVTRVGGNANKSDLSTRYRQYLSAGYNADEARKAVTTDYIKQVIMDTLAGGAAGGAMGGLGNFMGGRNVITGKIPSLNTEENVQTEAKTEEDIEAEDYLRSILEEANQMDINPENIRLDEQTEQPIIPSIRQQGESQALENNAKGVVESLKSIKDKANAFLAKVMKNKGQSGEPRNQIQLGAVPADVVNMVSEASGGSLNIADKYLAIEGSKLWHEIKEHSDANVERSIGQIPLNSSDISEIVETMYHPDIVENISNNYGPEQRKTFALIKKAEGYIVIAEAVGGRYNPNIVPEQILHLGNKKMQRFLNGEISIGDILYENSPRKGDIEGNARDIKNRVIAAKLAPNNEAPSQTSETYRHSPLSDSNVPQTEENVNLQSGIVEQSTIPSLTNRQLAQYTRQVEGLIDKLGMFGNKSFNKSLNNALKAVQNTQGEEQQNAIASLNNLVNQIDEQMAGSEVGVNQRTINQDMYDDMKRVTDGYVVKVNDNMLDEMGLTLKQLNDRVNTTARDGVNHIRFVKGNTGTPIDSVYNELYELSNHQLPDPRSMAEGDQLKAVYDYVTRAKAGKNEMAQTATWENVPVLENRTKAEVDMESQTDAILDKIANGTVTDEDYANFQDSYSKAYFENFDKPSINAIIDMMEEVKQAYTNYVENAGLDEETANATTANEVQSMIDSTIDGMDGAFRMDLQFHGGQTNNNVNTNDDSRKLHTGEYATSEFATNSFPRSKAMTKGEMNSVLSEEDKQYERVTHPGTLDKAIKNLEQNGFTNELKTLMEGNEQWDAVDVDEAMLCTFKAAKEARNMIEKGVPKEEAWKQAVEIFKKSREHATTSGQALEALKKWSSRTPEGKLAKAIAFAREAAGPGDERLKGAVKSLGKSQGFTFSDEFMADFLDKAHQYDGQDISFAKQARLDQELAHMVWDQIPKKFKTKFTSLWMDNLLASFRTLISRNVGGNAGKFLLDQTATKAIAGPIDSLVSRLTGGRTTTGFTKEGAKIALKGLKQGAFETTRDYWGGQLDPDKVNSFKDLVNEFKDVEKLKENLGADANVSNRPGNEGDFEETLKNNRSVFESKVLKTYDKLIKYGLAVSDNTFYRSVYNQTLYELNELRKSGKLEAALQNVSDEKFETWAKAYATAQGLEAVYQNDSMLSDGAMKIKNGIGQMSKGLLGVDVVSDASFPFVRTPMNVINTNLEFSPLGIVKNLLTTIKEIRTNLNEDQNAFATKTSGGAFDQGRFVRETSRNIVGSMLFVAALMMKNAGMLTGGYSDDPREKQAQKDAGMQEYAFVNPLNGNQYSVDWIPALGSNLVSAAAFSDAYGKPDQSGLNAIANGAKAGAKSLFEQSALQGLQRLVGQQNYNSEGSVIDNAIQTVANTASSAIVPSFVRQSAAALDPYKRNTYGMGGNESIINNAIAGIPFLRQALLQPRIGSNGQPMAQNAGRNIVQKWFDNLVNPAMVTVPSALADPVRDEANRLYESTKDTKAYQPKISLSYLAVDGHTPTTEEYTEFLQIADSAMSQIASDVIQSDYYQALSDEEKVNVLNGIYSAVQSVERAKYLGIDKDYSGADKAYFEGGAEGLMDYYRAKDTLSDMGVQNNPDNREIITEAMNNGTLNEMEQLGFDFNSVKKYEHATNYIPSLTPSQFQTTWNTINTDGNTSIKIDELIDYLNRDPGAYNSETALQYWNAFYTGTSEKIPVLVNGEWQAKSGTSTTTTDDIGQYGAGNIDLYNRPQYIQPDGSVSTVNSMSINEDGVEVLIPTIAYDNYGRPYQMTDQEAINHYHQTGEYLGKFNTPQEADAYAEKLHQQQERLYA